MFTFFHSQLYLFHRFLRKKRYFFRSVLFSFGLSLWLAVRIEKENSSYAYYCVLLLGTCLRYHQIAVIV